MNILKSIRKSRIAYSRAKEHSKTYPTTKVYVLYDNKQNIYTLCSIILTGYIYKGYYLNGKYSKDRV